MCDSKVLRFLLRWVAVAAALGVVVARAENVSREHAVDSLFADLHCPGGPGAAIGVYQQGRVLYERGYGCANVEHAVPITPQTLFNAASVSKQFTAFAAALLASEGRLNLDADIRTLLPDVPDFGAPITVSQLIHHTSGLRDDATLFELAGIDEQRLTQRHVMQLVSRQQALNFAPGGAYLYSNTGYALLAEIVAAASGRSFRQLTTERLFTPLGMRHSFFADDPLEIVRGAAESYERSADGKGWMRSPEAHGIVGSTGLMTNVADLMRWAGNFAHPVVGDAALIRRIGAPGRLSDGTPINYRHGLERHEYAGHAALVHAGSTAGFTTIFAYFPATDFAIALLMNAPGDLDSRLDAIVERYLGNARSTSAEQGSARAFDHALPGHYMGEYTPMAHIARSGAGLVWQWPDGQPRALRFRSDGSFDLGQGRYDYYRPRLDSRGRIDAIEEVTVGMERRPTVFRRVEPASPSAPQLAQIAGDYYSDELDVTYRFAVDDGRLTARTSWMSEPITFTPSVTDRFDSPWWGMYSIVVERDATRRVSGLRVHSDRIRHVLLRRAPTATDIWETAPVATPVGTKPRILLIHDMEGLAGQDDPYSFLYGHPKYAEGQRLLTDDVNATIEGLFAGGAASVTVVDGHGSGNPAPDILVEKLDRRARLLARDAPFDTYADLADTREFDAVALVGMHAKSGSGGFAAHTYTIGMQWLINGHSITETELVGLLYGRARIPVIFVSGDDRLAADLRTMPWLRYVTTKRATGPAGAELFPVSAVHEAMRTQARRAVERWTDARVLTVSKPMRVGIRAVPPASMRWLEGMPGVDYRDETIYFSAKDVLQAYRSTGPIVSALAFSFDDAQLAAFRTLPAADQLQQRGMEELYRRWLDAESGRASPPSTVPIGRRQYHGFE